MATFVVGSEYAQGKSTLRILTIQDDTVLLEQWVGKGLNQYIVTRSLFLHNGELHWHGSGAYFPCGHPAHACDTPLAALSKALDYLRGPQEVFVLISDTDEGSWVDLYSTMDKAKAALQKALDRNVDVQASAEHIGIEGLTADAYLDDEIRMALGIQDEYRIVVEVVN